MTPRIYTYKITFDEVPYWYWGVHKERKFKDGYLGSPVTNKWMWNFYTPRIQILEIFPFTEKGWEEANRVEERLIKPDLNNSLCLNESCAGLMSLEAKRKGGLLQPREVRVITGRKAAQRLNSRSNANADRSKAGKIGAIITNSQIWESTVDGFRSNAGNVSQHNKANGWDTKARVRVV